MHTTDRNTQARYEYIRGSVWIDWKENKEDFKDSLAKLWSLAELQYKNYKDIRAYHRLDKLIDCIYDRHISVQNKIDRVYKDILSNRYFGSSSEIIADIIVNNYILYNCRCFENKPRNMA